MVKQKVSILTDLSIVLLFSLALLSGLIFSNNWPLSHDGLRYLCHLDQFKDAFDKGILYPRWMPNYYGGYGYPIFLFYQPAYFFFSLIFTYFTPDILVASYASNVAMFFLGGAGAYFLVRKITAGRAIALFCSAMFLLTPYVFVDIYVRGDLSELLAVFITPWPMYIILKLKDRVLEDMPVGLLTLILSLALAAMVLSHPFTSMFFFPVFSVIMLAMGMEMRRNNAVKFLIAGCIALALSVIFSSPYWLTALLMKKYVAYHLALGGYYSAEKHVVYFHQLFSRMWGFEGSVPGPVDGMSFQLGLPHFILALLGYWLNRRNRLYLTVFILYASCILLMTPLASVLWKNIPLMNFVQFPWRLLSVIALLQIICISGIWKLCGILKTNLRFCSVLVACLVFTLAWNSNEFQFLKFNTDLRKAIEKNRVLRLELLHVYESFNEFLPKTASDYIPSRARGTAPMLVVSDPDCIISEYPDSDPHHMRYRISSRNPQMLLLNQLYFPGWKIILGEKELDESTLLNNMTKDGRIQVGIPACKDMYLEAFYDGPPGWYLRNIFIGIVFLIVLAAIMIEHRKYSHSHTQNEPV